MFAGAYLLRCDYHDSRSMGKEPAERFRCPAGLREHCIRGRAMPHMLMCTEEQAIEWNIAVMCKKKEALYRRLADSSVTKARTSAM